MNNLPNQDKNNLQIINLNGHQISVNIRNYYDQDNLELIDIFRSYPTSSSLSYVVDRSPDYFALCKLQGIDWRLIVAEKEKIFGSILINFDKVFLESKEQNICYTCDLRLDTSVRRVWLADCLMREGIYACREKYGDSANIFTCVLKDNQAGLKKNANLERDNIIKMNKVGEIKTYFFIPFVSKNHFLKFFSG
ncbi:MAG: hypothetical protein H7263_18955 [Candidatus Sericytochromatia bacterium]|nr:hypothetical protein [Candidatus Sericytochromatia bacterium]